VPVKPHEFFSSKFSSFVLEGVKTGPGLQTTRKGEALKTGKEIARPIGGIKPVGEE
jgi:hypothetical protein